MWNVLALGLVNWIATTIAVESELTRPLREFIGARRTRLRFVINSPAGPIPTTNPIEECRPFWNKMAYLCGCHLCTGTWIGLVESAVFGSPFKGAPGVVGGGLLYKAIGHLVLELRPQAWVQSQ